MVKVVIAAIKRQVWLLVGMQIIAILLVAMILTVFLGLKAGFSVLIGGLAWLVPSIFFTWRLTQNMSPRMAKHFIMRFYSAEFLKLILTILFALLAIKFLPISFGSFMIGMVAALMSIWLAPLMMPSSGGIVKK